MVETKAHGSRLASRVTTLGTVKLTVDHEEVAYCMHDFELMEESECPAEATRTGWRFWACHKYGNEFGGAAVHTVLTVLAATATFLSHLATQGDALVAV